MIHTRIIFSNIIYLTETLLNFRKDKLVQPHPLANGLL